MQITIGEGKRARVYTVALRFTDGLTDTPFDTNNPDDMRRREKAHIKGRINLGWTVVPNEKKAV